MSRERHFIIIDDDATNNMICSLFLKMVFADARVDTFTDPRQGLLHIKTSYATENGAEAVVFLDINMPFLNGWDFLECFDKLSDIHKSKVRIYMLSSSIDHRDIARAQQHEHVIEFLSKPLSKQKIHNLSL